MRWHGGFDSTRRRLGRTLAFVVVVLLGAPPVLGQQSSNKDEKPPCPPPGLNGVLALWARAVPPFPPLAEATPTPAPAPAPTPSPGATLAPEAPASPTPTERPVVTPTPPLPEPPAECSQSPNEPARGPCVKGLSAVELRDTIAVGVQGLSDLLAEKECLAQDGRPHEIVLYLDRRPLPSLVAAPPNDPKSGVLMFPLTRTEQSREVWTYLLGKPSLFSDRRVEVSVGIDDRFAVRSNAFVALRVIPWMWFVPWFLLFVLFLLGFVKLARRSDVLRDPITAPTGARPPYSLARLQAAWWFFIVLAAYLFIGMVTGDFSTSITSTVLTLLGISAGTVVGSAFVDASKSTAMQNRVDASNAAAIKAEIDGLDAELKALRQQPEAKPSDLQPAQDIAAKEALRADKWSTYRKLTGESTGFLLDILSDTGGVNFHRFQMLAWTIVLGIIFVCQVYRNLAMPEFSGTLLALMGISAGTFIGLKIPDEPSRTPMTPPDPKAQAKPAGGGGAGTGGG